MVCILAESVTEVGNFVILYLQTPRTQKLESWKPNRGQGFCDKGFGRWRASCVCVGVCACGCGVAYVVREVLRTGVEQLPWTSSTHQQRNSER